MKGYKILIRIHFFILCSVAQLYQTVDEGITWSSKTRHTPSYNRGARQPIKHGNQLTKLFFDNSTQPNTAPNKHFEAKIAQTEVKRFKRSLAKADTSVSWGLYMFGESLEIVDRTKHFAGTSFGNPAKNNRHNRKFFQRKGLKDENATSTTITSTTVSTTGTPHSVSPSTAAATTTTTIAITTTTPTTTTASTTMSATTSSPPLGYRNEFHAGLSLCNGCKCNWECNRYTGECPEPTSCHNNGRLVYRSRLQSCQCRPNFAGECCQTKLCLAGGTLNVTNNRCVCPYPERQYGAHCEYAHCDNGGYSVKGLCQGCDYFHEGDFCENIKCFHESERIIVNGSQVCRCSNPFRYSGRQCEKIICENYGKPFIGHGQCTCMFLFKGRYCEQLKGLLIIGLILLAFLVLSIIVAIARYFLRNVEKRLVTWAMRKQSVAWMMGKQSPCNVPSPCGNTKRSSSSASNESERVSSYSGSIDETHYLDTELLENYDETSYKGKNGYQALPTIEDVEEGDPDAPLIEFGAGMTESQRKLPDKTRSDTMDTLVNVEQGQ